MEWCIFTVCVLWVKVLYWINFWSEFSFYIVLIRETVYYIRYFLVLQVVFLAAFSNVLYLFNT